MIEIIGESGSSEYEAALAIKKAFVEEFGHIEAAPASQEHIKIVVGAKLSGYKVSDIDIVVCAKFNDKRYFRPRRLLKDSRQNRLNKPIKVRNFVAAVEVKDHDQSGVRINGDNIYVYYTKGGVLKDKSATEQNINQLHALSSYFKDLGFDPYVFRCLYMGGLHRIREGGAISRNFSASEFLSAMAATNSVKSNYEGAYIESFPDSCARQILSSSIFEMVMPSALDRRRMDLIVSETKESEELLEHLGEGLVCLRGHGGSGKTIMFLQAAWTAFDRFAKRSLVLTYNHALAADIRRSMALLQVPADDDHGSGITVMTVMSFVYRALVLLGVVDKDEDAFLEGYADHCREALELFDTQALTDNDVKNLIRENRNLLDFDLVFIDEAQDWPQSEADLVTRLFGPRKLCIADGIEQLLRGERTDWFRAEGREQAQLIPLDRCLRLKHNLSFFMNSLAKNVEINWIVKPNDLAGGGRVILLEGSYFDSMTLHQELLNSANEAGNSEIDFLLCVPSSGIKRNDSGERPLKVSSASLSLQGAGFKVWDGVDDTTRRDFPRRRDQFRVVHYASARGLEGWTVVLEHLDDFWRECFEEKQRQGLTQTEELAFVDLDEASAGYAWRKVFIALSRPIDTLVISFRKQGRVFAEFKRVAERNVDFIEFKA